MDIVQTQQYIPRSQERNSIIKSSGKYKEKHWFWKQIIVVVRGKVRALPA